ncbi:MAG: hypothetical protein K0U40_08575 [Betaproteobacteria bacterium]|nr:hypothetical protein [Betaproteobacteria bacterium]
MKLLLKPIICVGLITFAVQSWGEIVVIAETGQPAADSPEEFVYWNIEGRNATIGPSGHIAFSGAADTSINSTENNTNAVWTGLPGQLKAIIKENEQPVGFPNNVLFAGNVASGNAANIIVTRSGHVGFAAGLKGATQNVPPLG